MLRAASFAEVRRLAVPPVALVPTMGFLHEGHLSLVAAARGEGGTVVMSLFVNPLQFDDPADLARYPRDPERDATLAAEAGVGVLFAPSVDEMYPDEPLTRVVVRQVGDGMEGEARPGHFEGVATVVAKLLAGIRPDTAFFGRKDAQQLAVVRRMARDLGFPTRIVGCPTVRERDGLALSSRNVLIPDRSAALGLSRGLLAAADLIEGGERGAAALEGAVRSGAGGVDLEYATLADQESARQLARLDRPAFLAAAGRVGEVRIIDNLMVDLAPDGSPVVDRGVRLSAPSLLYRG